MAFYGLIVMEDHMSTTMNGSANGTRSINADRKPPYGWTVVLILGVLAASTIGTWFYINAPLLDASSIVAP
jgi:hypothetical protein